MDGNKDEALKCLRIAREALESGDRTRALKFATKARRLDPALPLDDLLSAIEGQSSPAGESSSSTSPTAPQKPSAQSSVRHRVPAGASSSSTPSAAYTEEQIAIVRQVRKKKDFYEILGLEKVCTVDDVRKAYRKLSLKVHPDKNKAPGAEEAFKAVSKAFQCLSNEESRKRYDLLGSDEPERRQAANPQGFNGFYDADIDPEMIFRNFFFNGMPRATTPFGGFAFGPGMGPRTAAHGSGGGFNLRALMQLLPVLILILVNFLPSSQPVYSLSRKYPYEHHFVSPRGVNYYVKMTDFEQKYPPNSRERAVLEERVENDYLTIVSENCQAEMQRYYWGFIKETPYCDMLKQFRRVAA